MRYEVLYWLCVGFLGSLAASAEACTFPTDPIYDPTQAPSDLIIEGVAVRRGTVGGEPFADILISNVHAGDYTAPAYRLKWWDNDGGTCEPPGPAVAVGQRVRIYLSRENETLEPQGWVLANEVIKNLQQIKREQTIAQKRTERRGKYFSAGQALAFNDPKEWLKIEDIPELRRSSGAVLVSFSVSPDGAMKSCTPGHVAKYVALDEKACKIIEQRAKLVPPIFPEEALGSFEMNPPASDDVIATTSAGHRTNSPWLLAALASVAATGVAFGIRKFL